ncbi:MAG: zf-HC2 domain-containing protein [Desulfomonile tiedjei]|uniref:Zf-HC2 domain-containing protein n=1 Tax=Desulfomonile tiedjei TaxID=2358 RepID=A0A9D6V4L5_9BACT|nr:zf-HC2 domain-containing protein [Desulfomonile tiedjei]
MNCKDRQIQISQFHRGELSDPEVESLLEHLEKCDECRMADREFKHVEHFLRSSADPPVPPFLNQRIIARVTEEMRKDRNAGILARLFAPLRVLKPLHAAGVIMVALCLGMLTGSNLLYSFNGIHLPQQDDVVSLVFGNNSSDPASFDFLYKDDQGNR